MERNYVTITLCVVDQEYFTDRLKGIAGCWTSLHYFYDTCIRISCINYPYLTAFTEKNV